MACAGRGCLLLLLLAFRRLASAVGACSLPSQGWLCGVPTDIASSFKAADQVQHRVA